MVDFPDEILERRPISLWILELLRAQRNVQLGGGCVFAVDVTTWGDSLRLEHLVLLPTSTNALRDSDNGRVFTAIVTRAY